MAVVRGDRIGESTALNKVSREAQTFYSAFVAAVPDDFGRFRVAPSHIWTAMYPRREPKPTDLRWVMRMVLELQKADAFRTYQVDGQDFAEVAKWRATGNMVHRCPEPPKDARFALHAHSARCISTAVARAKEWGTPEEVSILINRFNELRPRKADGRSTEQGAEGGGEGGTEQGTGGGTPVNSSTRPPVKEGTEVGESDRAGLLAAQAECRAELAEFVRVTGRPADQSLAKYSRTTGGQTFLWPDSCKSVRWLKTTTAKLRGERLAAEGDKAEEARASPGRKPSAASVTVGAMQQIMAEEAQKNANQSLGLLGGPVGDRVEAEPTGDR